MLIRPHSHFTIEERLYHVILLGEKIQGETGEVLLLPRLCDNLQLARLEAQRSTFNHNDLPAYRSQVPVNSEA